MWKQFQKSSNILADAKMIFFDRILNMFIVTTSDREEIFHKCGPRPLNLNLAKFFLCIC